MNKNMSNMNWVSGSLSHLIANEEYAAAARRLRHPHGWFKLMHDFGTAGGEMGQTTLIIFAMENGVAVGQMVIDKDKRAGIFVDPAHRRRGVGSLLIQHAFGLVGMGMSVCPDNYDGRRFFAQHELALGLRIRDEYQAFA